MKLSNDFGVRALLATIALVSYEVIIMAILVMLFINKALDFQSSLALAGLTQAPAMLAVGFYFGQRSGQTLTTPLDVLKSSTHKEQN